MYTISTKSSLTRVTLCLAVSALIVAGMLFTGCEQGNKKVKLRFKYEPGQMMVYELSQKGTSRVTIGDSLVRSGSYVMSGSITETVRRVVDDSTVELYDKSIRQYDNIVRNDSTITDSVEHTTEVIVYARPNGKIVEFEFLNDDVSEGEADYYKNYYEQGYAVFPPGELFRGYSWTQTTTILIEDTPREVSTTYEIKSFARERGYDCVVISYEGNMVLPIGTLGSKDTTFIGGVDRIEKTGMMYFAYKEGQTIMERDRWVLNGLRRHLKDGKEVESTVLWEGDSYLALKEMKPGTE